MDYFTVANGVTKKLDIKKESQKTVQSREYFRKMLTPCAIEKVSIYLHEEQLALKQLIHNTPGVQKMNFCIIGGGPLYYLSLAIKYFNKYTIIDPNLSFYVDGALSEIVIALTKVDGKV